MSWNIIIKQHYQPRKPNVCMNRGQNKALTHFSRHVSENLSHLQYESCSIRGGDKYWFFSENITYVYLFFKISKMKVSKQEYPPLNQNDLVNS